MVADNQLITIAIIDHDKKFFNQIHSSFRKEKDIQVCMSILKDLVRKESCLNEGNIKELLRLQPRILLFSQILFDEEVAMKMEYLMHIRDMLSNTRIVLILDHYNEDIAIIGVREGIKGYYMRNLGVSKIVKCVRTVARGNAWLESPLISRIVEEFSKLYRHIDSLQPPTKAHEERLLRLSPREKEILGLISKSYTNDDIAKTLFISEKTVKTHIRNIFEKTGVKNRAEAMLLVVRSGLVH